MTRQPRKILTVVEREPEHGPATDDLADLLDFFEVVRSGRWFLAGLCLACTLAAVLIAFVVMPWTYTSSAVLIPAEPTVQSEGAASGLVPSLPVTFEMPGQIQGLNVLAFLNSRTLRERLIEKYDLLPVLYPDLWDENARAWKTKDPDDVPSVISAVQDEILDDFFEVSQDAETSLITLEWGGKDPKWCAIMLERVISELTLYLENDYVSDAGRKRAFLETQAAEAALELDSWERKIPGLNLAANKIARETLAARTVYVELKKQLAQAKVAEAERRPDFKVLDPPFVPEKWNLMIRVLVCGLTLAGSLAMGLFLIFFRRFLLLAQARRKEQAPQSSAGK